MKPDIELADEELSELELAIEGRVRKTFEFEVPNVLGNGKKPLGKLRMRVPTALEQEKAIKKALDYAAKSEIPIDSEGLEAIKTCHILYVICLHITLERPAFPGPEWMFKNLGVREIGILMANYYEMMRVVEPIEFDFGTDKLKSFAKLCYDYRNNDAPNIFLQSVTRDGIAEIAIRMGILYHETFEKELTAAEDKK